MMLVATLGFFFVATACLVGAVAVGPKTAISIDYRWVYANPGTASPGTSGPGLVYANPPTAFPAVSAPGLVHANPAAVPTASGTGLVLQYNHMGMLNRLSNGSLAALWQAAPVSWEGSKYQGIYWAVSNDYGVHWSSPVQLIQPTEGVPIWAPVLHVQDSSAWLFYSVSRSPCWWWGEGELHYACGGDMMVQTSQDSGRTWSAAEVVLSFDAEGGIAKMLANKLALGPEGEWLLPFWREMGGNGCNHAPRWHGRPGVLISHDQGGEWNIANVTDLHTNLSTWLIEPAIAATQSGWIQVFRTSVGSIYWSASPDGYDWTPPSPSNLPNPNSKVDLIALDNSTLLLAFNDAPHSRSFLTLAASCNGGESWLRVAVLEDNPEGSFSYPTLQDLPEQGLIIVIYSVSFPTPNGGPVSNGMRVARLPRAQVLAASRCGSSESEV